MDKPLKEFRCKCGKLLCKGLLLSGFIEIKCKRCQNLMVFNGENNNQNSADKFEIDGSENK